MQHATTEHTGAHLFMGVYHNNIFLQEDLEQMVDDDHLRVVMLNYEQNGIVKVLHRVKP